MHHCVNQLAGDLKGFESGQGVGEQASPKSTTVPSSK
jgi:hypothetical protein